MRYLTFGLLNAIKELALKNGCVMFIPKNENRYLKP